MEIQATEEKSAKRGDKPKLRITKQQSTKANKNMDAVSKSSWKSDQFCSSKIRSRSI